MWLYKKKIHKKNIKKHQQEQVNLSSCGLACVLLDGSTNGEGQIL